jgi:hypothetical protein
MADNANLVTGPIWLAIIVIAVSLLLNLFLYASSRWYRKWYLPTRTFYTKERVVLPGAAGVAMSFYDYQPTYDNRRGDMIKNWPNPLSYIWVYFISIAACVYLLMGMNCAFTGGCERYAWSYVVVISILFTITMARTLFDYVDWRANNEPVKVKYA